jgi:protein TonB
VNTPLRIASITGTLALALSATAGAATIRLVPLSPPVIGASTTACAAAFVPAAVDAAPVEVPVIAAGQGAHGIAQVRIALDASGRLTKDSVLSSSGNRWLDRAALKAARLSRYSAEVRDCERVGGEYALVVDFTE